MGTTNWNTYRATGYTHDVANDPPSTGGVNLHQVRLAPDGWRYRIVQSNGKHRATGPVERLAAADGQARYETAKAY